MAVRLPRDGRPWTGPPAGVEELLQGPARGAYTGPLENEGVAKHSAKSASSRKLVFTVGHSTRAWREFLALLRARIGYRHMKGLGGLRHPRKDSPNGAWRNASFRGFADYMQTPEFSENLERLTELAQRRPAAVMCDEAVPWRCHRSLIADALLARGWRVEELSSLSSTRAHKLTPWAKVREKRVLYPPE